MNLNQTYDSSKINSHKPRRLQVYLAHAGIASRRSSEDLIAQGRVSINGKIITVPGEKVLPGDDVRLDGKPVKTESRLLYLVLNKPPLYISSSHDPQNRPLAINLLPPCQERLYNVGRLDYLSSGLILFTNDGDFAARIGHPRAGIEKEYLVESTVPVPDRAIEDFSRGIIIEDILYKAKYIERLGIRSLRIILVEGRNREIRRVFSHFRLHPQKLQRIRIGPVNLGDLKEGESRPLTDNEIMELSASRPTKIKSMEQLW